MSAERTLALAAAVFLFVGPGLGCAGEPRNSSGSSAPTSEETATTSRSKDPITTSAEVCKRLTVQSVADDLGRTITQAVAGSSGSPNCEYEFETDTGGSRSVLVAALLPIHTGGQGGETGFEWFVDRSQPIVGRVAEFHELDFGDDAIRVSGLVTHLGVVRIGDDIYMLAVQVEDADAETVDRLIETMATAFG